jgi:alkylated DNA repair dioxygenase AlkB
LEDNGKVSIYPNPANDKISIKASFNIKKIEILSLEGKCLYSKNNLSRNEYTIDLNLHKGSYLLVVSGESQRKSMPLSIY